MQRALRLFLLLTFAVGAAPIAHAQFNVASPDPAQVGENVVFLLVVTSAAPPGANNDCLHRVATRAVRRLGFAVEVDYELVPAPPGVCTLPLPPGAVVPLGSFAVPGQYAIRAFGTLQGQPVPTIDATLVVDGAAVATSVPALGLGGAALLALTLALFGAVLAYRRHPD